MPQVDAFSHHDARPARLIDYNGDALRELVLRYAQEWALPEAFIQCFRNPYIKHQLLSIALNGMTKFRTRILPQLLAGQKANGTLPARLTFALAALIAFYRGERNGETYPVQDDAHWPGASIVTVLSGPRNW